MSKKKKKKKKLWVRILLYFLLVCFIAILAIGTKLALDAKDMYEKAKIAKADAEQALSMFEVKEYAKAKKHINNIQTTLKDYINTLSTPLWNLGSYVPKYGHDFDLGRDMLALADKALDENVDDVFDMLENYPLDQIVTDDGYNVDIILNYLNFAEEKVPVAKSYLDEVRSANFVIDQEGLLQKYVGKADELFFGSLRQEVDGGLDGEVLRKDIIAGEAGTGVAFTNAGAGLEHPGIVGRQGVRGHIFAQHPGTDGAVADVGFCPLAEDAGGVGLEDADVVEHRSSDA